MFNRKKEQYVGYINAGNILHYVFGQDEHRSYMSMYTDKDISFMYYKAYFKMNKDHKIEIHCKILKDDSPFFYISIKNENNEEVVCQKPYHINMNLERFNKFFEEQKLRG